MANPAEVPQMDVEVLRQFRIIFKSVRRHFQSVEDAVGVSGSQIWALAKIAEQPGLRVTGLAKAMSIHQSTASNLVESMVGQGLIRRVRGAQDSRVVMLEITEEGQKRLALAPGPVRGVLPDALEKLPYGTLRDLHCNLTQLLSVMDALDAPGADIHLSDM